MICVAEKQVLKQLFNPVFNPLPFSSIESVLIIFSKVSLIKTYNFERSHNLVISKFYMSVIEAENITQIPFCNKYI